MNESDAWSDHIDALRKVCSTKVGAHLWEWARSELHYLQIDDAIKSMVAELVKAKPLSIAKVAELKKACVVKIKGLDAIESLDLDRPDFVVYYRGIPITTRVRSWQEHIDVAAHATIR
eukprot:6382156-Amphidinium_carterae.3